ncbi:MAG: hypothetical protein ACRCT1_22900 [Microcoleaceae cyanobacterium]
MTARNLTGQGIKDFSHPENHPSETNSQTPHQKKTRSGDSPKVANRVYAPKPLPQKSEKDAIAMKHRGESTREPHPQHPYI